MKKTMTILAVFACLMLATPAQAQIRFGLKGGVGLAKASFSKNDLKSDNYTGFFIGPMAEFTLPIVGLGVDAALLYSQTGIKEDNAKAKLQTFEVPVNLKFSFGLGSMLGAYFAAGPQFGYKVGGEDGFKKAQTSFNVGAGLKLIRHLQVGVNYNIGLTNMAEEIKNNAWQISLAYLF